ncbi:hydantoinase B/oxoprolinase family protein [Paenibacillus amylolyticus]|nr:hydantoinase B/oxoprolinase family protein [Paenibacillus amylolyticus]
MEPTSYLHPGKRSGHRWRRGYNLSLGIPAATTINSIEDWKEGDLVICNDPYSTKGMVTHLPDIHLIKPYFHEGRIIAYGMCFVHSSDVGGKVPGAYLPAPTIFIWKAFESHQSSCMKLVF